MKRYIKSATNKVWDVTTAVKQCVDYAQRNINSGIGDFEIEINENVDTTKFWNTFKKLMGEAGIHYRISGKDLEYDDHYYYMYIWTDEFNPFDEGADKFAPRR